MLEAKRLSKSFGPVTALHPLDLTIARGEVVCLLGANGAGKTTTINLFLGFLEPTSGGAFVNGLSVQEAPVKTKQYLAYIPEQVALYPLLSGFENLKHFTMLGGRTPYPKRDLYEFLAQAGLSRTAADRRVATYSKGMRQKVGVAIALAKQAKALLLDEPLSGLDPKAANEFTKLVVGLKNDGAAILMATHDIFRAKEAATRIRIMKAGRTVEELNPTTLRPTEIEQIYLEHMHDDSAPGEHTT